MIPNNITNATPPAEINKEKGCNSHDVKSVGGVLTNMLHSSSRFAENYRNWKAKQEHVNNPLKADDNGRYTE